MTGAPEVSTIPVALGAMRNATRKLSVPEWLAERTLIPSGYTANVQTLIDYAAMHHTVVTMLQQAVEVATAEAAGRRADPAVLASLRLAIDVASRSTFGTGAECRCGWTGETPHMCHRCHEVPGSMRVYQYRSTWSCDPCWAARGQT